MSQWRDSLQELIEGNRRFVAAQQDQPRQDGARRVELSSHQNPHSVILTCADSRVPPELIFDQGLGDLFVLRVAGNVIDPLIIASIEYATLHLETPLVVVMGHSRCGAMTAAVAGGEQTGHLDQLMTALEPAVKAAHGTDEWNLVDEAARINAGLMAGQLEQCDPVLSMRCSSHKLKIIPAYYRLVTGEVEFDTV